MPLSTLILQTGVKVTVEGSLLVPKRQTKHLQPFCTRNIRIWPEWLETASRTLSESYVMPSTESSAANTARVVASLILNDCE